ncbi:MAG: transposase [Anaerolineae bacterium]|nr:transposase [Anaerolineae bacterium]
MSTKPSTTKQLNKIIEFRQAVYEQGLVRERDAQFDLMDALLLSPVIQTFPELSQSPVFQRRWPSVYTAIERGQIDEVWVRAYLSEQVPREAVTVFALDTSVWPRPQTRTLRDLRYEQSPTQAIQRYSTVKGYAYSTLAWIPERGQSWALPVDTRRVVGRQTVVEVGVEQVKALCQQRSANTLNVIVADESYGNQHFLGALKDQPCATVVRLRCDRVLYGVPGPYQGHGRPRVHGQRCAFKEPETWGPPAAEVGFDDARYGRVRLRTWHDLHTKQDATTPFGVILAEVHLERDKPPKPIWLGYQNTHDYALDDIWRWFDQRWPIEPANRFRKQRLYWTWTGPQFQQPDRCDRWTLLVDLALWQVFLSRELVTDQPLPWQKQQTSLTPGRVMHGLGALFAQLGSPSRLPQPRGKSPGWPTGRARTRPKRFKVLKRGRKQAQST